MTLPKLIKYMNPQIQEAQPHSILDGVNKNTSKDEEKHK